MEEFEKRTVRASTVDYAANRAAEDEMTTKKRACRGLVLAG